MISLRLLIPASITLGWISSIAAAAPQVATADSASLEGYISTLLNQGTTLNQSTLGIDIIPSDFTTTPKFGKNPTKLNPENVYRGTLDTLLKLAVVDPRNMIGPSTVFKYADIAIEVTGIAGIKPIPVLLASFGIYESLYEMEERLQYTEGEFSMAAKGEDMGKIRFRQARATDPEPAALPGALEVPVSLSENVGSVNQASTAATSKRSKRRVSPVDASQLQQEWIPRWSGIHLTNWEFYLGLSTLAVKITRIPFERKQQIIGGLDLLHDTPTYPLYVNDVSPSGGQAFLTPVYIAGMCVIALNEGTKISPPQELNLQLVWRDGVTVKARWELDLKMSPRKTEGQGGPGEMLPGVQGKAPGTVANGITVI